MKVSRYACVTEIVGHGEQNTDLTDQIISFSLLTIKMLSKNVMRRNVYYLHKLVKFLLIDEEKKRQSYLISIRCCCRSIITEYSQNVYMTNEIGLV